jgi:hypothetical protein
VSEVTDRIKAYEASGEGWPELRDWLVAYKFVPAKRYDDPNITALDERDWDTLHVDGSWDEMNDALQNGQLTHDEYYEVAELRHAAQA